MTAEDALVESEPDVFDCDTCEHRRELDALEPENAEAWRFYGRLVAHRWIVDLSAVPWYLGHLTTGLDDEERDDLFARVSVIYDTLHPPKP